MEASGSGREETVAQTALCDAHAIIGNELEGIDSNALIVGTNPADWPRVISRLTKQSSISSLAPPITSGAFALGIHPWYVNDDDCDKALVVLKQRLIEFPQLRVGEIGLDKKRSKARKQAFDVQIRVFREQLRMACAFNRSVSIHCVRAHGTLVQIFQEELSQTKMPAGILLHSWSGSEDVTRQLLTLMHPLDAQVYFGVSAKINGGKIEGIARYLPADRILIESDLSIEDPIRGQALERALEELTELVSAEQINLNFARFLELMTKNHGV